MDHFDSQSFYLAPSILSADFWSLGNEIQKVKEGGVPLLHLDVMDGHFVPNLTIGPMIVKSIRKKTDLFLDTHLMLEHPLSYLEPFAQAGSNLISVHIECQDSVDSLIKEIHQLHCLAGIAISPETPIQAIEPYLNQADLFLVMSVSPGFGGQTFNPEALSKIAWLRAHTDKPIEVDGGLSLENVQTVLEAGARVIVAGSAVFRATNVVERVQQFYQIFQSWKQKSVSSRLV
ncbi:MAG: ribulose-phosphate 3-epimerase [Planctomycetota bacterium]